MTDEEPAAGEDAGPVALLKPADGVPAVSVYADEIASAAELLRSGHGPFAVDAERASGFRYSNRAYLIQIRRAGAGTVLIDPVSHGGEPLTVLRPIADVLGDDEWILHAADQDLPCLAEVGMRPPTLFDTELAGRLAGFDRVNLAAMVQRLLGLALAKGHGAADWSKRPLPPAWLNYAALDVEVLLALRDAVSAILAEQGKSDWAAQEFEHVRMLAPQPTRRDRWRRTSGIHKVRSRRALAQVRQLWTVRDHIASRRDIAPGRILPDSSIIAAAQADPKTIDELVKLPVFGGPKQRRNAQIWLDALTAGRDDPDPPEASEPLNGPPPPVRWSRRKPDASQRLEAARVALGALSQRLNMPPENLVSPELVRRLCWDWVPVADTVIAVESVLRDGGARAWQREMAGPVLAAALTADPGRRDGAQPDVAVDTGR
jgi:ribonuclease D